MGHLTIIVVEWDSDATHELDLVCLLSLINMIGRFSRGIEVAIAMHLAVLQKACTNRANGEALKFVWYARPTF